MKTRRPVSMVLAGLALCLGFGLLEAGCASRETAAPVLVPVPDGTPDHPVRESTLSYLKECAERWADDLGGGSHTIHFEISLARDGSVSDVKPTGSRLGARDMERCMLGALQNMTVPGFVLERMSSELAAHATSTESRGLIGQTETLDKLLIPLLPVLIEAPPAMVIVAIVIVGTAAMNSSILSEECQKEWDAAEKKCRELLAMPNPPRRLTGGYKDVPNCARGLVSQDCKGNEVDHGARPGRRT